MILTLKLKAVSIDKAPENRGGDYQLLLRTLDADFTEVAITFPKQVAENEPLRALFDEVSGSFGSDVEPTFELRLCR